MCMFIKLFGTRNGVLKVFGIATTENKVFTKDKEKKLIV